MKLIEQYLSLGKKARSGVRFQRPVVDIVIHWIGPYPGQSVYSPWYWWEDGPDGKGVEASAHFIVKGADVLQALPLDEVGWHAGDIRNYYSIGVEIIPANTVGEYAQETIETLKDLIRSIREIYPGADLTRHYDGTQKKDCPRFYTPYVENGEEQWIALRNLLDGVGGYDE
jgi:hypothetical protein